MTRVLRLGRSPAWRAAAIVAAVAIAATGWYLGSPLFIRTTLNEDLPELDVGDVVYVPNIGAYSCASAVVFNGIPPAKVIVV